MVVYTSTGNLWTVLSNTLNRPARQTITGPWHSHDSAPQQGPLSGLADDHKFVWVPEPSVRNRA